MNAERWKQIATIHEGALARSPGDRAVFIAEACGSDASLRAEIEALLEQDEVPSVLDHTLDATAADLLENAELLTPGATLGFYRVEGLLGAGGMGEVYRARDTKLGRRVALKVLPGPLAAERLASFRQEAQILASLNHPNIAAIHGLEDGTEPPALVLELVEGPTLAQRVSDGALSLEESLAIARQIAEALEAAHDVGVVHCDLKPANVTVTANGVVKVLDFGIARLAGVKDGDGTANSTAVHQAGTAVVFGTPAYMAPEQVAGQPADKRSDIWAFGCVLYEMLTGRRAFGGDVVDDTLANVIRGEPDWDALPTIPAPVDRFLRRSLQKDRRKRLADAADARLDIDEAIAALAAPRHDRRNWHARSLRLPILLAAAAAVSLGALTVLLQTPEPEQPVLRFLLHSPEGTQFTGASSPVLSPSGRHLAFAAVDSDGVSALWTRPLDSLDATRLPSTEGATLPFWSPDGQSIGFFADGKLRTIAIAGGTARTICDAPNGAGGTWSRNGTIVFAATQRGGLSMVRAAGGEPAAVTTLDAGEFSHREPVFLPDGRRFLFLSRPNTIFIGSLDSVRRVRLVTADSKAVFAQPGYLLYVSAGALIARAFDGTRGVVIGDEQRIAGDIRVSPAGLAPFSASETGMLMYRRAGTLLRRLTWLDRSGTPHGDVGEPDAYTTVALSPSGESAAVQRLDSSVGTHDIWIVDLRRGVPTRLTFEPTNETSPQWSPDERQIVYSVTDGTGGMFRRSRDGGQPQAFTQDAITGPLVEDWSPDNRALVYHAPGTRRGIWVLRLAERGGPIHFLDSGFAVDEMQLSPNGRWMAYASDEPGRFEVYIRAFPQGPASVRISSAGGSQPQWRADGRELFYLQMDGALMAVDVDPASGAVGTPTRLFATGLRFSAAQEQYAVAGDGQRFLLLKPVESASAAAPLTVVTNWAATLRP